MSQTMTTIVEPPSLDHMLHLLNQGQDTHPHDPASCIRFEFNTPHSEHYATSLYAQRIQAFLIFLEDFYLVPMKVVGLERGCVRVFVRPFGITANLKKKLSASIIPEYFHRQMARCEIDLVYVFGQKLTLTRRRK